jgi:hypothetical protein
MPDELADLPIVTELGDALLAGFRRAERRRPFRGLAALALAATVVVTLAIVSTLGGGALAPQPASAATVLRAAAAAAAARPDRFPRAGQFLFVRVRTNALLSIHRGFGIPLPIQRDNGPYELVATVSWESWSPTRTGEAQTRVVAVTFPTAAARTRWIALGRPDPLADLSPHPARLAPLGTRIPVGGPLRTLSAAEILALPTAPRALSRELFGRVSAAAAVSIVQNLNLYPIGGPLRAAMYRALALEPGIRTAGTVRVLSGRAGVALAARDPSGLVADELVLDPATGEVLGTRTVSTSARSGLAPGTVRYESVIVSRTITNRPGPPRR